jgi:hypothetical protein
MDSINVLKGYGYYKGQTNLIGLNTAVGYEKKFKLLWFATQMNTFIHIAQAPQPITWHMMEQFSMQAFQGAINNNPGWPRGLQSGVASIAILRGVAADEQAVAYCRNFSRKHWSAFEIPVIFDEARKQAIWYDRAPIWGVMYHGHLSHLVNTVCHALGQP